MTDEERQQRRDRLFHLLSMFAAVALSVLGARFGVPIPPPVVPPGSIPAPNIVVTPPATPPTLPEVQQPPKSQPEKAICRLSFPGVGCTATIIGPRRVDGRWWVLTASHCVKGVGQHGTIRLLDGRSTGVVVASLDRTSDCCWMYTETNSESYPFALMAPASPGQGTPVWHAGYGVDRPGNREDGQVAAGPDQNGQLRFRLSVSSGDSGGGIVTNKSGEVVSCVCCTTARGRSADVWGASPEAIHRALPTSMVLDDWQPIEVPLRKAGDP